ncbi:MAG TPA: LysR family transcriptional regulator [Burkholderiales bacterium]|nr:LysR family transcriptional regulator [Burkholderiales bacterium]
MTATSPVSQLDWNLLRAFLAVVDAGSLTAATRLLASSQPTLSRQIAELESILGVVIFERVARGVRLTAGGKSLLPAARQMETAARALSLVALGQTQQTSGTVRLTASEMFSAFVLPKILARLRQNQPQIQIELLASNRVENLLERQADIAIRHTRPRQGGLVAKRIGEVAIGAFAHTGYLQRMNGKIEFSRAAEYNWIGMDTSDILLRGFRKAGLPVERDFFAFRCDNQIVGWQMALAGAGIGFAPLAVAKHWPDMQRVLQDVPVANMPIWLTAHRELRSSARIGLVFDALAQDLQTILNE